MYHPPRQQLRSLIDPRLSSGSSEQMSALHLQLGLDKRHYVTFILPVKVVVSFLLTGAGNNYRTPRLTIEEAANYIIKIINQDTK